MTEMKKASRRRKNNEKLQILAKASLAQHGTWWRTFNPNFKKFGTHFANFVFFWPKHRFFSSTRRATWRALIIGSSYGVKLYIFLFSWKVMHAYPWPRDFDRFWASIRVKNTLKMTFLPLFGHTGSRVGRTHFWRGKWKLNSEIPLVLEIR